MQTNGVSFNILILILNDSTIIFFHSNKSIILFAKLSVFMHPTSVQNIFINLLSTRSIIIIGYFLF